MRNCASIREKTNENRFPGMIVYASHCKICDKVIPKYYKNKLCDECMEFIRERRKEEQNQ